MHTERSTLETHTLLRNVGYSKHAPATLDDACEALAQSTGEAALLAPGDRVLNAGFGFGDQDMYWIERFGPREIVGLNVTQSQVEQAQKRVAECGRDGYAGRLRTCGFQSVEVESMDTSSPWRTSLERPPAGM